MKQLQQQQQQKNISKSHMSNNSSNKSYKTATIITITKAIIVLSEKIKKSLLKTRTAIEWILKAYYFWRTLGFRSKIYKNSYELAYKVYCWNNSFNTFWFCKRKQMITRFFSNSWVIVDNAPIKQVLLSLLILLMLGLLLLLLLLLLLVFFTWLLILVQLRENKQNW